MEKIKIEISVSVKFDTEKRLYRAALRAQLPANWQGSIDEVLMNSEVEFFGVKLIRYYMNNDKIVKFENEDVNVLEREIDGYIKNEIKKLRKIKKENLLKMRHNRDDVLEFDI